MKNAFLRREREKKNLLKEIERETTNFSSFKNRTALHNGVAHWIKIVELEFLSGKKKKKSSNTSGKQIDRPIVLASTC